MHTKMNRFIFSLLVTAYSFLFIACNHVYIHPDLDKKTLTKKIILVDPDISVYELGLKKINLNKEWTNLANRSARNFFIEKRDEYAIIPMDEEKIKDYVEEYKDIRALFRAANRNILHEYYVYKRREVYVTQKLNYKLGPLLQLFEKTGGDFMLFIYGIDYIASDERKSTAMGQAVAGILIGMFTGVAIVPMNAGGHSYIAAAIIDKSGEIQWSNFAMSGRHNLHNKDDLFAMLSETLTSCSKCRIDKNNYPDKAGTGDYARRELKEIQ